MSYTFTLWNTLRNVFRAHAKAFAVIGGGLALFGMAVLGAPVRGDTLTFRNVDFDQSWLISLGVMLVQGQVSGRDFSFAYGPVAQVFSWLWIGVRGTKTPADAYPLILLTYTTAGIVMLGIVFGLIRQLAWRSTLFAYFVICILGIPFVLSVSRPMMALICAGVLSHTLAASTSKRRYALASITGGTCVFAQLLTTEIALYTLAGVSAVLVAYSLFARFPRILGRKDLWPPSAYLAILGVVIGVFLAGNVLISVLYQLTSAQYGGLFNYQRYAMEIMRGYNNTEGLGWGLASVPSIILGLIAVYVMGFILINLRKLDVAEGYSVVALAVFGTIQLKMAMVRSDLGHIVVAFIPLIIVFLTISKGWFRRDGVSIIWAVLLIALVISYPLTSLMPFMQVQAWLQGTRSLREQTRLLAPPPTSPEAFLPPGLAQDAGSSSVPILDFPHENELGLTLGRPQVAPMLNSLDVHTIALQQMYVDQLRQRGQTLEVIYGLDNVASIEIDGVQNITRVPLVFEYLYRNFTLKSDRVYGSGFYILQHRPQAIEMNGINLTFTFDWKGGATQVLRLENPATCGLVRINATVAYPPTNLIGRANTLNLKFAAGQSVVRSTNMVAIENGSPFTTYISLIDDSQFYKVFGSTGSPGNRWDNMQITVNETDILGVSPNRIDIHKLECINP